MEEMRCEAQIQKEVLLKRSHVEKNCIGQSVNKRHSANKDTMVDKVRREKSI